MSKGKFTQSLIDMVEKSVSSASDAEKLHFLHNTRPESLRAFDEMGGMPMPSIAVTRTGLSFDNFGDITLVGKKDRFNPTDKTNELYGADAYTVRSPSSISLVDAKKLKIATDKGGLFDQVRDLGGYTDAVRSYAYDMTKKGGAQESRFRDISDFFDRDKGMDALYLKEKTGSVPIGSDGKVDVSAVRNAVNGMLDDRAAWSAKKKAELFSNEKYFIANPDRDYYSQSAKLVPYTSENITAFMNKKGGASSEGGVFSSGGGANRAAVVERFGSLGAAKSAQNRLVDQSVMDAAKSQSDKSYAQLKDVLRDSYKYSDSSMDDDITSALKMYDKKGAASALKQFDFNSSNKDAVNAFKDYAESLKAMPTEYFESKPRRSVGLDEFGAAIVPHNTPEDVLNILNKKGINVHKYATPEERQAIRKNLNDYAFQAAAVGGVGVAASMTPQKSFASSLHEMVMTAKPTTREIMDAQVKREKYLAEIDRLNKQDR